MTDVARQIEQLEERIAALEQEQLEVKPDDVERKDFDKRVGQENVYTRPIIAGGRLRGGEAILGTGDDTMRFDETNGLWIGHEEFSSAPFSVDLNGNVTMTSATVSGYIATGDAAADVNSGVTAIEPGKILISGSTHLDDWNASSQGDATLIDGGQIYTGSVTTNEVNFTVVDTGNVVGTINSSTEGISIDADVISISGTTTFSAGYNPSDSRASIRQTTAPTQRPSGDALEAGDVWIDTDDGDRPYTWNGSSWIEALTIISGGNIVTGSITATQIDANTITTSELNFTPLESSSSDTGDIITTINASSEGITIDADNIAISGSTSFSSGYDPSQKAKTYRQTTAPSSPNEGDVWIDTDDGDRPYTYNGTSWMEALTIIDGGNITTGTIDASVVTVDNINASNINTGILDAATVDADAITTGTLTGTTVQTDVDGNTRIAMGESSSPAIPNEMVFDSSGTQLARFYMASGNFRVDFSADPYFFTDSGVDFRPDGNILPATGNTWNLGGVSNSTVFAWDNVYCADIYNPSGANVMDFEGNVNVFTPLGLDRASSTPGAASNYEGYVYFDTTQIDIVFSNGTNWYKVDATQL